MRGFYIFKSFTTKKGTYFTFECPNISGRNSSLIDIYCQFSSGREMGFKLFCLDFGIGRDDWRWRREVEPRGWWRYYVGCGLFSFWVDIFV